MKVVTLVSLSLYAYHRLMMWMEDRGWIYYKNKPKGGGGLGVAFLEINKIANPAAKVVIERKFEEQDEDESADAKSPSL